MKGTYCGYSAKLITHIWFTWVQKFHWCGLWVVDKQSAKYNRLHIIKFLGLHMHNTNDPNASISFESSWRVNWPSYKTYHKATLVKCYSSVACMPWNFYLLRSITHTIWKSHSGWWCAQPRKCSNVTGPSPLHRFGSGNKTSQTRDKLD